MPFTLIELTLLVVGFILTFFGLQLYKTFLKLIGFIIGGAYGIYLFMYFVENMTWDPIFIFLTGAFFVLVLGTLGIFIAQFTNHLLFFLAGGLSGVMIGKLVGGLDPVSATRLLSGQDITVLVKPEASDLLWFIGGGILFLIALDSLIMISFIVLGVGMVWIVLRPLDFVPPGIPDWIVPGALGLAGLTVQEATRRRKIPGGGRRHDVVRVRKVPKR